jgi:hypothetical protein
MVRGLLRPKQGPSLPPSTQNARRGEYDNWEPLGRLLMPDLHKRVDEILKARKAMNQPVDPNEPPPSPRDESPPQNEPAASHGASAGADSPHGGGAVALETNEPQDTPADSGPDNGDSAAADPQTSPDSTESEGNPNHSDSRTINAPGGALTNRTDHVSTTPAPEINTHHVSNHDQPTVAAHYADVLLFYTRHADPAFLLPPAYAPRETEIFCATCDPRSQTLTHCLLSNYVCDVCLSQVIISSNA